MEGLVSFLVFMFVTVELVNTTAVNHVVWSAADDGRQRRREVSGVTSACFLLSFTTTLCLCCMRHYNDISLCPVYMINTINTTHMESNICDGLSNI